ncbi:MAG: trypsin-like serine protease [Bdellovibrionaceae bacterium]|nr:trypsin-like serine protease [Pseudobdellovibrionaceae bacterium]
MQFQRVWYALFGALITLSSGNVIAMNKVPAMNSCFIEFRVNNFRVHSCSGTALSGKMLLTAGHCILFGSVYLNADDYNTVVRCPHDPPGTEYSVIKAYMHPYFDKYLVSNARSALPLAIVKEFDRLQLKNQGMDPNIDIGFMEIESSKSFPGPFAKLALSKADFDAAIKNECYIRGYRGDFLKKEEAIDLTSSIFLRRIFDFKKSTNDKYGFTVATDPKESYIYQGDSGASVVCMNRLVV